MTKVAHNLLAAGRPVLALAGLVGALGGIGLAQRSLAAGQPAKQAVFTLRPISVFDQDDEAFLRGDWVRCEDKPSPEVKAYPPFASKAPIYGSVRIRPQPR